MKVIYIKIKNKDKKQMIKNSTATQTKHSVQHSHRRKTKQNKQFIQICTMHSWFLGSSQVLGALHWKGFTEKMSLEVRFEGRKRSDVTERRRQSIPDRRCLKVKGSLAKGFGGGFGFAEKFFRAWAERARGLVDRKKRWEVGRQSSIKATEGESGEFVLDPVLNRKPVEFYEKRGNMCSLGFSENETGSVVLNSLKARDLFGW